MSRVAVLDIDYHHGNGTQDIFWTRGDVFYASVHADPATDYPFFWGHADERGTREYNLALGERRATAAKNYLIGAGIPANRVSTISYGKERPVALGSDEESYAQNRRAVTIVVG